MGVSVRIHPRQFTRTSLKTWEDKFLGIPFLASKNQICHPATLKQGLRDNNPILATPVKGSPPGGSPPPGGPQELWEWVAGEGFGGGGGGVKGSGVVFGEHNTQHKNPPP